MPCIPSTRARTCAATGAPIGGRSRAFNRNQEWAQTDRVLDGERTRGNDTPAARCVAAVGVIIVAFADVNHQAAEGTLKLHVRPGLDLAQMKDDIAWLKSQGKKVLISLGGGGEYFTLVQTASIPNFVNSVTQIVSEYGFDGIDIDFESPSLVLDPGDTDFRHPKTSSVVNLIDGLRQLRRHFGPDFMLTLVPEGTQIPAGYPGYGGQF